MAPPFATTPFLIHPAAGASAATNLQIHALPQTALPQTAAVSTPRPAIAVASTIVPSATVATVNPAFQHIQNPLFRPIFIPPAAPRTSFALPTLISPSPSPTDQTLFEEPQNPANKHFLPRYGIAATASASGQVKWVSLSPASTGFQLTVHLAETTDAATARGNLRLSADTRYLISATVQDRIVTWDLTAAADTDGAALKLTLAVPDFLNRDLLYQAMIDPAAQARLILRRALPLALPTANQPNLYVARTMALDTAIPFTFSKDLDTNVFAQLGTVTTGPAARWKLVTVNWNGRGYPYFQSTSQPDLVYFLPDSFKISRQDKKPHAPALSVAMVGDDPASVKLTLSYLAQPVWDPRRTNAAATALQQLLSLPKAPSLALFQAAETALVLNLPSSDPGGASALVDQSGVLIDIAGGIQGGVVLNLTQFRQVYDALFDQVSQLLTGEVRVTVDRDVVRIPFIARATDFAGDFLEIDSEVDSSHGKLIATLTNVIESPIHIEDLSGSIVRDGAAVPAAIAEMSPPPPLDLTPYGGNGASQSALQVTFASAPAQSTLNAGANILAGLLRGQPPNPGDLALGTLGGVASSILDARCAPLFDLSKVHVVPDPKALWRAIMQNQQVGPIIRSVTLKAVASMVKPAGQISPDTVVAIQIVFDNGQTVNFDGSQGADAGGFLNQTVKLAVPIDAFVLGSADTRTYRYRIDFVTAGGVKTGNWTSDNRDVVYIVSQ